MNILDKYCILGGGAAGIGLGKCLTQANLPFDIIEAEDNFGGNWYAGQACSKVYRSAHLISSKKNTQFSDFPMPNDYPHYPNHSQMLKYLRDVATHFKLYDHVQFNTRIEQLEPVDTYWKVTLSTAEVRYYKGVLVANGLLREARYPSYPGKFTGMLIHSSQYLEPLIFKDKRVLIVGGGNSGCDIAVDAAQFAKTVYHSTHRGYHYMPKFIDGKPTQDWQMEIAANFASSKDYWEYVQKTFKLAGFNGTDYGLPVPDHEIFQCHPIMNSLILYHIGHGNIQPMPDILNLESDGVVFINGRKEMIDIIVYATGYQMSLPFLSSQYLPWRNGIPDLFCHYFHRHYDNIVFSGYVNSPSGFGNLSNTSGRMLVAYLRALENNTRNFQEFKQLKAGHGPDLGNDIYLKSDRHKYEVDLWKLIKYLNMLRIKFESSLPLIIKN